METLELRIETAEKALKTLKVIEEPYSVIVRDAAMQRFTYTSEIFWKTIRGYLDLKIESSVILLSPVSRRLSK